MAMKRIVSVSGGKDSTACYLLAMEYGKPFDAVFADTGHESQQTYDYIAELPGKAGGPPIKTVRADFSAAIQRKRARLPETWGKKGIPEATIRRAQSYLVPTGNPFVDASLLNGIFPAQHGRYCTRQLKTEPIDRYAYRPAIEAGYHVVSWQGIRAEESLVRRDMPYRQRVNMQSGLVHVFRPMLRWTLNDVMTYVAHFGLKVNPLYGQGFTRVGCFPCIFAQKQEIALLADRYPEAIDRLEKWEALIANISRTEGRKPSFFDIRRDPMAKRGERPSGIRTMVEWSQTKHGGRQYDLIQSLSAASSTWARLAPNRASASDLAAPAALGLSRAHLPLLHPLLHLGRQVPVRAERLDRRLRLRFRSGGCGHDAVARVA